MYRQSCPAISNQAAYGTGKFHLITSKDRSHIVTNSNRKTNNSHIKCRITLSGLVQYTCSPLRHWNSQQYIDIIMTTMASQITSLMVVYSTVYSDADQRKHQSSTSLAFVWGIHRDRWIPRTKGQLCGNCFHFMTSSWGLWSSLGITPQNIWDLNQFVLHTRSKFGDPSLKG